MNKLVFFSPTKLLIGNVTPEIERHLQYRDTSVDFQIAKMRQNIRWKGADPEGFQERMEDLKSTQLKSLLYQDLDSNHWTLTGLAGFLQKTLGLEVEDRIERPEGRLVAWQKPPPPLRYYQREAVDALITSRHGAISLPTGSGKSVILLTLLKELGLKSVVFTPSSAITEQLYDEAVERFGKKMVGIYSGSKKQLGKLFTIATGQSLARVEEETEAWEHFSSCKVLLSDESHCTPAETFKKVALGVCADAPYRFFVSATQIRGDGAELLLKGIIGPIVYSKSFESLVEEGFLAKPMFKSFRVPPVASQRSDPNDETRTNFYKNHHVNKMAASIAQNMVTKLDRPTVILIEEFEQFLQLKNYITEVPYEFVHGGAGAEVKERLPSEFWIPDKSGAIARFNSGETKLLIGTSAISTGVDLRPTGCLIYLQGGKSEISVRQGIGRGTRIVPGKKDFWVVDFNVPMSNTLQRHYRARKEIYETMGKVEEA